MRFSKYGIDYKKTFKFQYLETDVQNRLLYGTRITIDDGLRSEVGKPVAASMNKFINDWRKWYGSPLYRRQKERICSATQNGMNRINDIIKSGEWKNQTKLEQLRLDLDMQKRDPHLEMTPLR